jgi:hypothetical protein
LSGLNLDFVCVLGVQEKVEIDKVLVGADRSGRHLLERKLGSHHGRGQDLGVATRIRFVPDEGWDGVDDFGRIGAFAEDGGDLVRRHVVRATGQGFNGVFEREGDISMRHGATGVAHCRNAAACAVVEARRAEHKVVTHLRFGVDGQIDYDVLCRMQGIGSGPGQSKIDPVGDSRIGGRVSVWSLEIRGVEVARKRHFLADVIEREASLDVYRIEVGDLLRRDISADQEHGHGDEEHGSDTQGHEDLDQGEGVPGLAGAAPHLAPTVKKVAHGTRRTRLSFCSNGLPL